MTTENVYYCIGASLRSMNIFFAHLLLLKWPDIKNDIIQHIFCLLHKCCHAKKKSG